MMSVLATTTGILFTGVLDLILGIMLIVSAMREGPKWPLLSRTYFGLFFFVAGVARFHRVFFREGDLPSWAGQNSWVHAGMEWTLALMLLALLARGLRGDLVQ